MQGLQHQAVAAERHDDLGVVRLGVAIALGEPRARLLRFGDRACNEGNPRRHGAHGMRVVLMAHRREA